MTAPICLAALELFVVEVPCPLIPFGGVPVPPAPEPVGDEDKSEAELANGDDEGAPDDNFDMTVCLRGC